MKKKKWFGFILVLVGLLVVSACQADEEEDTRGRTDGDDTQNEDRLDVITTLYPLAFFANEIGGEYINATSILPSGSDAHTYEPTSKTMIEIAEADLFIYNEQTSESYAENIEASLSGESVTFLEAAEGIELITYLHDHEDEHDDEDDHAEDEHEDEDEHSDDDAHDDEDAGGDVDGHVWLSPTSSIELSENIMTALIELAPEHEAAFREGFAALKVRLEALDQDFHDTIDGLDDKTILVTHAAYNYWARDFGIEQIAVSGLSPSNEPSQRQLIEILDLVENQNLNYILFEQNITSQVSEVITEEANLEVRQLHNISTLTSDDEANNEDYFSLMERNLAVLEEVLMNK
ncbi:zinc transport system substrate-binding protein [Streptohalobacillus salinus]|uniref:Zinc transport system substrate-binding protein n=1 Tax=Streptohalobacillus salinus TaxID=621096 RepID=A0A2V3WHI8_9BACI|nr:zinc ABC transporter substrate-binding protein [Streptohalobacillus salinus]PXW93047.1 zinc transport system substrate-binding protein [Streptohalobacillus salinus]